MSKQEPGVTRGVPESGCGWLVIAAAVLLASTALFLVGFVVGRAATPRPSVDDIPALAFVPVSGAIGGAEPDLRRTTGTPQSSSPGPADSTMPAPGFSGTASWYDNGPGFYAAAGPALRVGDWRGRVVTVCAAVCIRVRLVDFCGCYGSRLVDLSPEAFRLLAPLSRGLVTVSVRW